jgi:hypothetical protein
MKRTTTDDYGGNGGGEIKRESLKAYFGYRTTPFEGYENHAIFTLSA